MSRAAIGRCARTEAQLVDQKGNHALRVAGRLFAGLHAKTRDRSQQFVRLDIVPHRVRGDGGVKQSASAGTSRVST